MAASTPDGHYERDILLWCEQQADPTRRHFAPSMRRRTDLEKLFPQARQIVSVGDESLPKAFIRHESCPVTLDDLSAGELAILAIERCLAASDPL